MILDTTFENKEQKQLINDLVGSPYSIYQSIKLKGVGSKRMIIKEVSPNLKSYMNLFDDLRYANIELRPVGIIIHINKGLKNFSWIIPFYQLVLYNTDGSSIHAQGKFIHFEINTTFKENKAFFEKLLDLKIKFDEQYKFTDL